MISLLCQNMQNYQYSPLTLLYILHVLHACDPCTFHDVTLWCYKKPWQSTWKATCNITRLLNSLQWMKKANQHFSSILLKQNLQKKKEANSRDEWLEWGHPFIHTYTYIYILHWCELLQWVKTINKSTQGGTCLHFHFHRLSLLYCDQNTFIKIPLKRFIFTRFSTGSNQTQHTLPDRLLIVAVHSAYCISQQVC